MRQNRSIARAVRNVDRIECFAEGSNLIDLDENRIRTSFGDPAAQEFWIRYKEIVADNLNLGSQQGGHRLPTIPVAFGETIFD